MLKNIFKKYKNVNDKKERVDVVNLLVFEYINIDKVFKVINFDFYDGKIYVLVEDTSNKLGECCKVLVYDDIGGLLLRTVDLCNLDCKFDYVLALQDNKILLCMSRCEYFSDGNFEDNVYLVDYLGNVLSSHCFGDGIESIRQTMDGNIVVGYADEGIYGNNGWGEKHNGKYVEPFGKCGLVIWSLSGDKIWEYSPLKGNNRISDCYSMNIDDVGVIWLYYDMDYKLVSISKDFNMKYYDAKINEGAKIACYNGWIISSGGYGVSEDFCRLSRISNDCCIEKYHVKFKTFTNSLLYNNSTITNSNQSIIGYCCSNKLYYYDLRRLEYDLKIQSENIELFDVVINLDAIKHEYSNVLQYSLGVVLDEYDNGMELGVDFTVNPVIEEFEGYYEIVKANKLKVLYKQNNYGLLFDKLVKIINRWDPVDLICFSPYDEYYLEVKEIAKFLSENDRVTIKSLEEFIHQTFINCFGENVFSKTVEECNGVAREVLICLELLKES